MDAKHEAFMFETIFQLLATVLQSHAHSASLSLSPEHCKRAVILHARPQRRNEQMTRHAFKPNMSRAHVNVTDTLAVFGFRFMTAANAHRWFVIKFMRINWKNANATVFFVSICHEHNLCFIKSTITRVRARKFRAHCTLALAGRKQREKSCGPDDVPKHSATLIEHSCVSV